MYFIICSLLSTYLYYYMGGTKKKKCRNIYKLNKETKHVCFTVSVCLSLVYSSEGERGPMCYIQTHIHARIQTLRQTGLRGAIVIIEKKRKKKKELKFVVLIFLGAGRRKILRTFICLGTLVGNETRGNRGSGQGG